MLPSFIPAADLGEIPAEVGGALFGGVDGCRRGIFILEMGLFPPSGVSHNLNFFLFTIRTSSKTGARS